MSALDLSARPEAIAFDPRRTAVIVVDMQNDFGSEGGMFHRAGIDIAPIKAIVPCIAEVLAASRVAGVPVIYLKQQHRPDMSDVGGPAAPHYIKHKRLGVGDAMHAPDGSPSRILIEGTWNTAIVEALRPHPGDIEIGKSRYSGFFGTGLAERLRGMGIDTLVIVGATTSICVDSTVRNATFNDFRPVVLRDCTAEPIANDAPRTNHEATLLGIELLFGWTSDSVSFIDCLQSANAHAA